MRGVSVIVGSRLPRPLTEGLGDPTPTKYQAVGHILDCLVAMKCQQNLANQVQEKSVNGGGDYV